VREIFQSVDANLANLPFENPQNTVKKASDFPYPMSECHEPNSPWPGINKKKLSYSPRGESLVSDIRAGDGKITNLFLQCNSYIPQISYDSKTAFIFFSSLVLIFAQLIK
jgi:hypothetical protein